MLPDDNDDERAPLRPKREVQASESSQNSTSAPFIPQARARAQSSAAASWEL